MIKYLVKGAVYDTEVGYTLVSIGWLNDAGFSTTFANTRCIIHDAGGSCIAEVPWYHKWLLTWFVIDLEIVSTK